jgi:hypothetical protein
MSTLDWKETAKKFVEVKPAHELKNLYKRSGDCHQRFGQWVCNNYLAPLASFPELFYADEGRAFIILHSLYWETRK